MTSSLVGSEMCIRDRGWTVQEGQQGRLGTGKVERGMRSCVCEANRGKRKLVPMWCVVMVWQVGSSCLVFCGAASARFVAWQH
eukprot:5375090-Prorocentrum_lima.AAC.1